MQLLANELLTQARHRAGLELLAERILQFFAHRAHRRRLVRNYETAHKLARKGLL